MKHRFFSILLLCALHSSLFTLSSCSDFLKEEDKDKVIPRTMDQFEAMLHKEGFCDVTWFFRSEFLTDDITENTTVVTTAKNKFKALYTWAYDIERTGEGDFADINNVMWGQQYNDVLVANYILERATDIVDADKAEARRYYLEAEAHFLRARAYFELINIYATPYDAATASTTLGVPLREGTGISNNNKRNTMAEVYGQIESDLNAAIRLFDASDNVQKDLGQEPVQKSLWHPNKKAAQLLLSRVYLYKGEWDNVIATTDTLIKSCPQGLYAMNRNISDAVVRAANPEVLHTWGIIAGTLVDNVSDGVLSDIPKLYRVENSLSTATYGVSNELLNLYSENDVRPLIFFSGATGIQITAKWHPQFSVLGGYSYRLSEAYLNRAEAYAALGKVDKALDDMKALLSKRIDGDYTELLPTSDDALTVRKFVLDQRRLELCFENHRWFDLRRSQSWYPKDITHVFSYSSSTSGNVGTVTDTEVYTLSSTSPNYTFELPLAETTVNPSIELYGKRETLEGVKK